MKRRSVALLCMVLCLFILQINVILSNAQEKVDLFDEILLKTNSRAVEYGLKASFKSGEEPQKIYNHLIKSFGLYKNEMKSSNYKNEESRGVEFSSRNLKGYIETLKNNNEDTIIINICEIGSENGLISLKDKVRRCITSSGENIKYFQYLKAKMPESVGTIGNKSIYNVNQGIIKLLKSSGTENIETVNINNGLSTIAYTKKYTSKLSNNKLIDFNYAICNYSSGRYIIIGTPEIITTY